MRAAILREYGAVPEVGEAGDPSGDDVVEVLAAGLNPIDLRIASGELAARRPELPSVVGSEGVGRTPDGRRVYFGSSSGSLAERAAVPPGEAVEVPDGVGDAEAVAYGIAGQAAWLALDKARLREGETVLVLGASGTVGAIAVQLARLRGAGKVIAASRRGDGHVDPVGPFGEAIDVVIDPLWGAPAAAAIAAMGFRGRLVQLGQSAGGEATFPSADIRFKELEILGHTNFATPPEERATALRKMWAHHAAGELHIECETIALEDAAAAWERQAAGPGAKLVVVPGG